MSLLVRFHLRSDTIFHEMTQSVSMVRVSDHVQDVSMQRHGRIVQHGDGSPRFSRKALSGND